MISKFVDLPKKVNINNKLILLIVVYLLGFTLPTFATSNWVQIGNKMYIDTNSVRKENYFNSNYNNYYSVWIKWLNDGSKKFLNTENYYKTKIWYTLQQNYIDCKNKRLSWKSYIAYDLKGNVVESITQNDYNLLFYSIAPGTTGDLMYGYVCQASNVGY